MSENSTYDPSAPEGDGGVGGQYVTRKDFKVVVIAVAVLALFLSPIYTIMKGRSERYRCAANLGSIEKAIGMYVNEHDNGYPPIARTETVGSVIPSEYNGTYYTWASDVGGYMDDRASFACPSAKEDEVMQTEDPRHAGKTLGLSYGMYIPYSGYLAQLVEDPDNAILIAETSNRGARNSFDPSALSGSNGPTPDAFAIGWNDSNAEPSKLSQTISRVACYDAKDGRFSADSPCRHGDKVQMLTASGKRVLAEPGSLTYRFKSGRINSMWALPPKRLRGQ